MSQQENLTFENHNYDRLYTAIFIYSIVLLTTPKKNILLCKKSKQKTIVYNHFFVIVSTILYYYWLKKNCKKKIKKKLNTRKKNHPEFEYLPKSTLTFLTLHCNIFFHKNFLLIKKLPLLSALPANYYCYTPYFSYILQKIMKNSTTYNKKK